MSVDLSPLYNGSFGSLDFWELVQGNGYPAPAGGALAVEYPSVGGTDVTLVVTGRRAQRVTVRALTAGSNGSAVAAAEGTTEDLERSGLPTVTAYCEQVTQTYVRAHDLWEITMTFVIT